MMHVHRRQFLKASLAGAIFGSKLFAMDTEPINGPAKPNIIIIYGDDIGFGDFGCYGGTGAKTPNVDRLAEQGLRFSHAYATSATCTPSRYSMMTGQYAWRKEGTEILAGDASLIIDVNSLTMASLLKNAGYSTGVVGKWHLGLGESGKPLDWNSRIKPGPNEIGFDYSFLMPATGDRVPCVYTENGRVVNLDPSDPIKVSYGKPFPGEPDGKKNRDQLKMDWCHYHYDTIVNGVSRLGFMTGGKSALWVDEDRADIFVNKGIGFIEQSKDKPFFLFFATHDVHVPRMPHPRFVGATDMGPRGDAIVEFDWCVGQIMGTLDRLGLAQNTLIILTSDNGPVLDDGYRDGAVDRVGDHKPAGPFRGGKFSAFEGGTREPFIARWPKMIKPGTTDAVISQVDLLASFAALTGQQLKQEDAPDSMNMLDALLGKDKTGRPHIIQQSVTNALTLIEGQWKYIEPNNERRIAGGSGNETASNPKPQLYNTLQDIGERYNLAAENKDRTAQMAAKLEKIKRAGCSRDI